MSSFTYSMSRVLFTWQVEESPLRPPPLHFFWMRLITHRKVTLLKIEWHISIPQVAWFHKPSWDLLWMVGSHPARIFHFPWAKWTLLLTKRRIKVSQLQQLLVNLMEVQAQVLVQYEEHMSLKQKHQRRINKGREKHMKYFTVPMSLAIRVTSQQRITRNHIVSKV